MLNKRRSKKLSRKFLRRMKKMYKVLRIIKKRAVSYLNNR
jgi:hypothetical protein